jgi:hypothetical protein
VRVRLPCRAREVLARQEGVARRPLAARRAGGLLLPRSGAGPEVLRSPEGSRASGRDETSKGVISSKSVPLWCRRHRSFLLIAIAPLRSCDAGAALLLIVEAVGQRSGGGEISKDRRERACNAYLRRRVLLQPGTPIGDFHRRAASLGVYPTASGESASDGVGPPCLPTSGSAEVVPMHRIPLRGAARRFC